jgi:hypothetical protein
MNMKKVLRLTESELVSLVNKMITEAKRLKNQDIIDAILDKISSQGIDSLTKTEKYILDNPDDDLDKTEDSDFMSHELDCLKSYIEFMFEPSDVETDENGNYVNHEGGDLYVWNNNETPEDTEDCFERFFDYLRELVNSGAFAECEGMDFDDVDAHIYEFFLDEIERQKHFRDDFDELLQ